MALLLPWSFGAIVVSFADNYYIGNLYFYFNLFYQEIQFDSQNTNWQDLVTFLRGLKTGIRNGKRCHTDARFESEAEPERGWKKRWFRRVARSDPWWGARPGTGLDGQDGAGHRVTGRFGSSEILHLRNIGF